MRGVRLHPRPALRVLPHEGLEVAALGLPVRVVVDVVHLREADVAVGVRLQLGAHLDDELDELGVARGVAADAHRLGDRLDLRVGVGVVPLQRHVVGNGSASSFSRGVHRGLLPHQDVALLCRFRFLHLGIRLALFLVTVDRCPIRRALLVLHRAPHVHELPAADRVEGVAPRHQHDGRGLGNTFAELVVLADEGAGLLLRALDADPRRGPVGADPAGHEAGPCGERRPQPHGIVQHRGAGPEIAHGAHRDPVREAARSPQSGQAALQPGGVLGHVALLPLVHALPLPLAAELVGHHRHLGAFAPDALAQRLQADDVAVCRCRRRSRRRRRRGGLGLAP
mmetsp:Transcript_115648/g.323398  ORF Transcript_115648/g.323398 Transcript_115648/m.323398 type:complete len:339 (+) Transcript_115648:1188-2204(+)